METLLKQCVGIDIAKASFKACFACIDLSQNLLFKSVKSFDNTEEGFIKMITWMSNLYDPSTRLTFVMEATGVYYENLAFFLHHQELNVSVILPNKINSYAKSLELKSKTDKIDSKVIARIGLERNLNAWKPVSPQFRILKELTRERENLMREKLQVNNQLHSKSYAFNANKSSIKRCNKRLKFIEGQIDEIEEEVRRVVSKDETLKEKIKKLESIRGIGFLTAVTIVAETNGFALINNKQQLVSYAGLDVVEKESGTSVKGRTRISKRGNSHIRRVLHFPALSAVKYASPIKSFYERVNQNKASKLIGAIAVQRKLLILMYTMWKNDTYYIEELEKPIESPIIAA